MICDCIHVFWTWDFVGETGKTAVAVFRRDQATKHGERPLGFENLPRRRLVPGKEFQVFSGVKHH